jgi:hypothetical protein
MVKTPLPKTGAPAGRALEIAGHRYLEDLVHVRAADLGRLHGVGPKALRILRAALAERGLSFADETASDAEASDRAGG